MEMMKLEIMMCINVCRNVTTLSVWYSNVIRYFCGKIFTRAAINIALANYIRVNYYELQAHNFLIKTPKTPAEPETRPGFYYIN